MGDYVTNHVAMQGKGSYNSNSALQWAAMIETLPLFNEDFPTNKTLTIVEYGASQGANSVIPFKHILEQITKSQPSTTTTTSTIPVTLAFCDRPSNDFSALAQTVASITWPESITQKAEIFPSMIPRSFFEPILPPNSADIGFSLASLHHLNRVPAKSPQSNPEDRRKIFATQAKQDLQQFLQLRAREFKPNTPLVLTFVGASSSGVQNYSPLVESCKIAMGGMIQAGKLALRVLEFFEVLVYDRAISEVREVLESEKESWSVESCCEKMIQHPAVAALAASQEALSSEEYARVAVEWEMAVIGGYFTTAVAKGMGVGGEEQEGLLREWTESTVKVFLREFRDAVVECCFFFVKLRRAW
ncbi:hypothetical protein BDV06DRAFT_227879 [Aspergillus oleicola]